MLIPSLQQQGKVGFAVQIEQAPEEVQQQQQAMMEARAAAAQQ
jgi:hypothetical protein